MVDMSPTQRDNSSSKSGRAAANSSRYKFAISASPRICTDIRVCALGVPALNICMSAGAEPEMTASAGVSSPASNAARPPKQVVRTRVMPSTLICRLVPSSRRAREAARVDAAMFRFKTASADANQAGVAGMLDLVAAMHGDDAAAEIVIARLDETRRTQHL